ncbi:MAG: hypothetical protein JRH11_27980, partial [Deltaproteobacteria bacterium]|nr:hypothetical protein [Deltaproteobacteria bacterium]
SEVPVPLESDATGASGVPPASEEAEAAAGAGDSPIKTALKTTTEGAGAVSTPADDLSADDNNFDFSDVTASEAIEEAVAKVTSS